MIDAEGRSIKRPGETTSRRGRAVRTINAESRSIEERLGETRREPFERSMFMRTRYDRQQSIQQYKFISQWYHRQGYQPRPTTGHHRQECKHFTVNHELSHVQLVQKF
jgi:hypothetical protein